MTFPERGIVVAEITNTSFADVKSAPLTFTQAGAERRRAVRVLASHRGDTKTGDPDIPA